jgi:hypothetical protein
LHPDALKPRRDWTALAARAAFAGFVVSLLAGLLVPVYTDEIGWRMQLRAGIDGGVDRLLSDICGPNTIAAPPWFMLPLRSLTGWLNLTFADPLYVRIVGVACAIGFAFALRALIARLAGSPLRRNVLTALAFGLLGLGVLPLMLTMSRPDQAVLVLAIGAVLATVVAGQEPEDVPRARAWLWPLVVLGFGVAAVSWHLKGILFAPLFLLCLAFAGRGRRALGLRLALAALFAGLSLQAASYWSQRLQCPGDPVLAAKLAEQNIASLVASGGDWRTVAATALRGANPNGYILLAEARRSPMSTWLSYGRIDQTGTLVRLAPMLLAWNALLLAGLVCLVRALAGLWRERRVAFAPLAAATSIGLMTVWGMSQLTRNDYEAMVVLPVLALAIVLSLASVPWPERRSRQAALAAGALAAISLIAQADVLRRYLPTLLPPLSQPGAVAGQGFSVSPWRYGELRETIRDTARLCGIGAAGRAHRPLLDDVTYFAMADSYRPFHVLGVFEKWNGSIRDPEAYLRAQGSEGMILHCRLLTPEAQARGRRRGDFCCISTR